MYFIKATLEEREREEFVRLKKVKVVLDKKKVLEAEASKR
jgi:vacuolar-type H+-ATPase subunit D/Vma8